jgi:hypothetical protein
MCANSDRGIEMTLFGEGFFALEELSVRAPSMALLGIDDFLVGLT